MKAKINGIEVDCTPEEFKAILGIAAPKRQYKKRSSTPKPIKGKKFTKKHGGRCSKTWTQEELRKVWVMHTESYSLLKISQRLERSKIAISAKIRAITKGDIKINKGK